VPRSGPGKYHQRTDQQERQAAARRWVESKGGGGGAAQRDDDRRAGGQFHSNQIYAWNEQLLDGAATVFSGAGKEASREAEVNKLYAKIGQLIFLSQRSGR
jgi:hypothetical protein